MMKRFRKLAALLLAVVLTVSCVSVLSTSASAASGYCGGQVEWYISDYTLYISGTGPMWDYSGYVLPWSDYYFSSLYVYSGVTHIGAEAFLDSTSLTSVSLPSTVTSIGDGAFVGCYNLSSITLPSGLQTMGEQVFRGCDELDTISISSSNAYFSTSNGILYDKNKTKVIAVPEDYTGSYTMPSTVTTVGDSAFYGCDWISSITFSSSLTTIGPWAFYDCTRLGTVTIPNSVKVIGEHAFAGCTSLKPTLSSNLTTIGDYAFRGCTAMTSVTIGSKVTSIGNLAFDGCTNLTTLTMGSAVKEIGYQAFADCSKLKSAVVPAGVTTIQDSTFYNCSAMTSVTIPASVTTIKRRAFDGCSALTSVTYGSNRADWNAITIEEGNDKLKNASISVTSDSKAVTITKQPRNVSVADGMHVVISLVASGDGLTYKWYYRNRGADAFTLTTTYTGNTYALVMNESRAGREVYCVVTDKYGNSVQSNTITMTMALPGLKDDGIAGEHARWEYNGDGTLRITGTGYLFDYPSDYPEWDEGYRYAIEKVIIEEGITYIGEYQFWQHSSLKEVYIPTSVTNIQGSVFGGCTSLAHVYYAGTSSQWSSISIGSGNSYLTAATMHYSAGKNVVKITQQPTSVSVANGAQAAVKVVATGDGLTYAWYYKNKGADEFKLTTTITGNVYSVAMDSHRNGRQVYCVVTDRYGNKATSNIVTLSLVQNKVKITSQPQSVSVANGVRATVKVGATGDGLTYKWYYKNRGASAFTYTSTFTGNTYSIELNASRSGRQVYCVVSDQYGNSVKTNTVSLNMTGGTIVKPVAIVSQPQSVTVANGATATVRVGATGDGLTYKWYYKNKGASSFTLTTSFTGNTYSTVMNADRSGRQLYCVVTDKYGNKMQTNTVTIAIKNVVKITSQPKSVMVANGAQATVKVGATGDGLTYKWYYKNKGASSFSLTTSFTGNTYSTTMNANRSGRQLYCVVTDKYGNKAQTSTVTITMKAVATITQQPKSVTVASGAQATVKVGATGDGLTYAWYYKDAGASSFSYTASFTGNTYSTVMNATRNGRQLYCIVSDKYGNSVKTNTVTIKQAAPLKITAQPKSASAQVGTWIATTVQAEGDGLSYKWYVCNPGSSTYGPSSVTGNTYGYTMTADKNGRKVYCVVSDQYGQSVTSNVATLSVSQQLRITQQPTSVSVKKGATATIKVTAVGDGLTYKWYYKDWDDDYYSYTSSFTGNTYSTVMTNARAGRWVYCVVTDKYGNSVTSTAARMDMSFDGVDVKGLIDGWWTSDQVDDNGYTYYFTEWDMNVPYSGTVTIYTENQSYYYNITYMGYSDSICKFKLSNSYEKLYLYYYAHYDCLLLDLGDDLCVWFSK